MGWRFKRGAYTRAERRVLAERVEEVPAELRDLWPTDDGEISRVAFLVAARTAWRECKEQRKTNPEAPEPPVLQSFNRWKELGEPMATKTTTKTGGGARLTATRTPQPRRYTKNGRPMSDHENKLSNIAWQCTKGMGDPRLSTAELRDWLAKHGVADPEQPGWEIELPNGYTIGCVSETGEAPARPAAKKAAKKETARPAAAKKETAKRPAKKAAKKEPAKRTTRASRKPVAV